MPNFTQPDNQPLTTTVVKKLDRQGPSGEFEIGASGIIGGITTGTEPDYTLSYDFDSETWPRSAYKRGLRVITKIHATNTGAVTLNINSIGAKPGRNPDGSVIISGQLIINRLYEWFFDEDNDYFVLVTGDIHNHSGPGDGGLIKTIVQAAHFQTGVVATGTTTIPNDDTVPQNTEGDEYMSVSITPTNINNKLLIEVVCAYAHTAGGIMVGALFQDTDADALAAMPHTFVGANSMESLSFKHEMTADTVSPTIFKLRLGSINAGTTTFNGASGAEKWGGVLASSIRVTESRV